MIVYLSAFRLLLSLLFQMSRLSCTLNRTNQQALEWYLGWRANSPLFLQSQ